VAIEDAKLLQEVEELARNGLFKHHISTLEHQKEDQTLALEIIISAEIQMVARQFGAIPLILKRDGNIVTQSKVD